MVCPAHDKMVEDTEATRIDIAVIRSTTKELAERLDRNAKYMENLTAALNNKMAEHDKIFYGDTHSRGVISMSKESFDYVSEQKSNFNTRFNGAIQIFIASIATITLIMMGFKR